MAVRDTNRPTWQETQHQHHTVGNILTLAQYELPAINDRTAAWTGETVGLIKAFRYEIM